MGVATSTAKPLCGGFAAPTGDPACSRRLPTSEVLRRGTAGSAPERATIPRCAATAGSRAVGRSEDGAAAVTPWDGVTASVGALAATRKSGKSETPACLAAVRASARARFSGRRRTASAIAGSRAAATAPPAPNREGRAKKWADRMPPQGQATRVRDPSQRLLGSRQPIGSSPQDRSVSPRSVDLQRSHPLVGGQG